jgi:hypothetical protein
MDFLDGMGISKLTKLSELPTPRVFGMPVVGPLGKLHYEKHIKQTLGESFDGLLIDFGGDEGGGRKRRKKALGGVGATPELLRV